MTDTPSARHRRTIEVYEARAGDWAADRLATVGQADAYTERLEGAAGIHVDLGCGPGWNLPGLPPGTIALDAARAMLDLVPTHVPGAPRVQADLVALPFGRHSLDGAFANRSYVHLDRRAVPMALWDLHRSVKVGGVAFASFFEGDADHVAFDHDDFGGRSFSLWPEDLLRHVIAGAGFSVESFERHGDAPTSWFGVTMRRERALADVVAPDMELLLVGLNPSEYAADAGVGFARPGNRAWPALLASGLAAVDRDPVVLLGTGHIGMTDLVKRATPQAKEVHRSEFRAGLERLDALCGWLEPQAVCVIGLTGWRAATGDRTASAGWQDRSLGGRPVYLMPNPSGLNAHVNVDDLADHFRAAHAPPPRSKD